MFGKKNKENLETLNSSEKKKMELVKIMEKKLSHKNDPTVK